jgi:hypothetical protein
LNSFEGEQRERRSGVLLLPRAPLRLDNDDVRLQESAQPCAAILLKTEEHPQPPPTTLFFAAVQDLQLFLPPCIDWASLHPAYLPRDRPYSFSPLSSFRSEGPADCPSFPSEGGTSTLAWCAGFASFLLLNRRLPSSSAPTYPRLRSRNFSPPQRQSARSRLPLACPRPPANLSLSTLTVTRRRVSTSPSLRPFVRPP